MILLQTDNEGEVYTLDTKIALTDAICCGNCKYFHIDGLGLQFCSFHEDYTANNKLCTNYTKPL